MSVALPMQLLRAREALMRRFRPYMRELGVTDQQGRILRALAEVEWIDMLELSTRCCIHPASLSRIIPRLTERRLVRRRQDTADARRIMVSLTSKGGALQKRFALRAEQIYGELADEIGPSNFDELHRCLKVMIDALGGPEATVPSDDVSNP
ncbi:MAG TPA: MarR family transcriptional regulator [Stellaceae bacterium]|nr:MarR family transcriptional regulator [Stellaceae bacterium]